MDLSNLQPAEGSRQNDNFRRGRGHGSGNGKTAGKGHKGQKARSGAPRPGFEGGQMPLYRRLPKRGFKNRNSKEIVGINVDALNRYEDGAVVTVETMIETGLVSNPRDGVKILGNGEVTKKLTVKANAFSESAKAKIEAGGDLMFKTFINAFKVKDVRRKIFYVLMMLVVIRLGSQMPVPGVNTSFFANYFANNTNEAFSFLNAFTGGGFDRFSIFALSITPYITSSIIIQLLTIAIPRLEEMQRDGEEGRKKMTAITRYVTVGLALFESVAMAVGFGRQGLLTTFNAVNVIVVVAALTAGSAFLMWVGEQINDKGVGNGISMVLLINILSRIPQDMVTLYETFVKGKTIARGLLMWIIIAVVIIAVVVLVLILNGAERRIPVQYSKKMAGRKMVGGQSSNIPLKVNTAGVIPIIFASSIMSFPSIILSFVGKSDIKGIGGTLIKMLNSNNWFDKTNPVASLGLILYIVLVIFFAYFYTSITFNPMEVADNMKKQGGFIPGIRPGKSTVDYLNNLLSYIIFIGAAGLTIVAVIPFFFNGFFKANVSFGGTSLIIIASVILETLKQIESMMLVRNYKGFLND